MLMSIVNGVFIVLLVGFILVWGYTLLGLIVLAMTGILGAVMDRGMDITCKYVSKRTKQVFERIRDVCDTFLDKYCFLYEKFGLI